MIFHSVLLLDEITAILSFFLIPIRNNALETALACSMYSCVDVFIQTPPCFVFKASGIEVYLVDNKGNQRVWLLESLYSS
jgi:hypothetical protein